MPTGEIKSRHKKYFDWLQAHPDSWTADPKDVINRMKADGLIKKSTYWRDVRVIPDLMRRLRESA